MSSSEVTDPATKRAKYNEYMRDYRLLNPDKVKKIEKNRYYKNKAADSLTPDEIAKYKDYLDKVFMIKKAINDLMKESPETAYAVIMDTVQQLEAN
jgi:hypothetical protein